ncbi:Retrovirus-related Pol polyprotein from transposon 297 [Eumeta japonica]|uniref:Retrovirus-related Pol polyprotein from transposon 297 n=1 Tax=Eumeta variegata TaxID=151549 RepID=A0A4C1SFA7_EUMVA|nr:Retrovirus-related Pol polyprotein from transposon 297 [Eumeta japonica]
MRRAQVRILVLRPERQVKCDIDKQPTGCGDRPKRLKKNGVLNGKRPLVVQCYTVWLCNAFERLLEKVLVGLTGEACLVYLDDVILIENDYYDHLRKLEQALRKIRNENLKLSPKKCILVQKQVNYLGHVIAGEGIATDSEKFKAVNE